MCYFFIILCVHCSVYLHQPTNLIRKAFLKRLKPIKGANEPKMISGSNQKTRCFIKLEDS